jgi:hypothetical protein
MRGNSVELGGISILKNTDFKTKQLLQTKTKPENDYLDRLGRFWGLLIDLASGPGLAALRMRQQVQVDDKWYSCQALVSKPGIGGHATNAKLQKKQRTSEHNKTKRSTNYYVVEAIKYRSTNSISTV